MPCHVCSADWPDSCTRKAIRTWRSSTVRRPRAAGTNPDLGYPKEHPMLSAQTLLADLLDTSPLVVNLLLELRVDCIGCSMNKFCTLEELCDHYELDIEAVLYNVQERTASISSS